MAQVLKHHAAYTITRNPFLVLSVQTAALRTATYVKTIESVVLPHGPAAKQVDVARLGSTTPLKELVALANSLAEAVAFTCTARTLPSCACSREHCKAGRRRCDGGGGATRIRCRLPRAPSLLRVVERLSSAPAAAGVAQRPPCCSSSSISCQRKAAVRSVVRLVHAYGRATKQPRSCCAVSSACRLTPTIRTRYRC
jgi:hypothetical protein